ncbi:CapA family protein [Bacillota bacterium Meth-B3]
MKKLLASILCALVLAGGVAALAEPAPGAVYAQSLKMSKAAVALTNAYQKPGTVQLGVSTRPQLHQLTDKTIRWISDNPSVAAVDENGLVTARGEGQTRVRAEIQGRTRVLSVACKVTVRAVRVSSLSLDCGDLLILDHTDAAEKSERVRATVTPATATFQQVEFTSSNDRIASVDENGHVTARGEGEATITATADQGRKSVKFTVRVRDKSGMVPVVISAGGDIVLGGDPLKKTDKRFERLISQGGAPDYGYVLKYLKPVFERDDLTILNLEGSLKGRADAKKPERKYNFVGKPEYAQILVEGSVEAANIVNNHINDYGTKGDTKRILRDAGIVCSDTGFSAENSAATVRGIRVGFVGFQTPYSSARIREQIFKARKHCDVVVVSFHWGEAPEHKHPVLSSQIVQARRAVNAGADLVLGHHPHVIQGIERYNGKYIFYGLGAVESSGSRFKYPNFIMRQTILVGKDGYTEPQEPEIYPIFTSGAPMDEENNCQPILLGPGDPRYDTVKSQIDRYSQGRGLKPAPYKLAG